MSVNEGKLRYAFYGRVSTDDAQDPSLSLPRQLAACQQIVQASGGEVVALFWDIESGRKNLSERGSGAHEERDSGKGRGQSSAEHAHLI